MHLPLRNGTTTQASPGGVICSTIVPGSGRFQLSDVVGLGDGLGLVFTIIGSLTLTLTLTLTTNIPVFLTQPQSEP